MPTAEIISVGTELLLGNIINTNEAFLSEELAKIGISVFFRQCVGDNRERLKSALRLAVSRSDIVITSGGLGPTYDDITKEVAASCFDIPLILNEEIANQLRERFARKGIEMPEENLSQAYIPAGARILDNEWGTAPGIYAEKNGKLLIMLPGVPREIVPMFREKALPLLKENSECVLYSQTLSLYGIGESSVDELLCDMMKNAQNPTVAPYAKEGEVQLRITARASGEPEAKALCEEKSREIFALLGEYIYAKKGENLQTALVERFRQKGLTIATAESCTGGLIAKRITEVAGSSAVIEAGVVAYSEKIKKELLGVREETLARFSVFSEECALEMARGARKLAQSSVAVATTGICGPGGGTPANPVATVYIAAVSENKEYCERCDFGRGKKEREHIRYLASSKAIAMALKMTDCFHAK